MKSKTKKILLIAGIALLGIAAGGLIGVASETSWDHALGRDKTAGGTVTLNLANVSDGPALIENKVSKSYGNFLDEGEDEGGAITQYGFEYTETSEAEPVDGDTTLDGELTNWTRAELVIKNYNGYVDSIEIGGLAGTTKDDAKVTVYVDGHRFGSDKIGRTADSYEFDGLFLRKGDIKIVFENSDSENTVSFSNVVINPAD